MNGSQQNTESRLLNALVYIIVIITVAMITPLVYKFADDYSNSRTSNQSNKEVVRDNSSKNRKYTVAENTIDISGLKDAEYDILDLITAKITDDKNIILFCSSLNEITPVINDNEDSQDNVDTQYIPKEYETVLRIGLIRDNNIDNIDDIADYSRVIRYDFLESMQNEDYIFKDFSDGTFFMSNSKSAFLFDLNTMKTVNNYTYPKNFHVYHTALSNNKEMLAMATEEGFYVAALNAYMGLTSSNMKEIIAPVVNASGVSLSARYPVWANNDERVYYKLYADNYIRNAGVTTPSPGGNEQLSALDCNNFIFLNNDSVFYYFIPGTEANPGDSFRCGYFNISDKKMTEVMKSQVYYFDIDISSNGNHLAALSYNGNMIKISVIDIHTKKLIYSSLYNEIYDFSFSPDEKNVIIYGRTDNKKTLKIINIDWTEE